MDQDSFSAVHNNPARAGQGAVKKLEIRTIEPASWGRDVSAHNASNTLMTFALPAGDWTRLDSFRLHGRFRLTQATLPLTTSLPYLQPKYMDMFRDCSLKLGAVVETNTECGMTNLLNFMLMSSDYANSTLSNACFYTKHAIGETPSSVTSSLCFADVTATVAHQQFIAPPPMWQFWTSGDTFRVPMGSTIELHLAADLSLAALGFGVANTTATAFSFVLDELYLTYETIQPEPDIEAGISSGDERYLNYLSATVSDSGAYTAATMDFSQSVGHYPAIIYYLWMLTAEDKAAADQTALWTTNVATARVPLPLASVKLQRLETYINGQQIAPDLVVNTINSYIDSSQAYTELLDGLAELEIVQDRAGGTLWSYDRQREMLLIAKRCLPRDPVNGGAFESDAFNETSCVVRSKITHTATITSSHCYRFEVSPHQVVFTGPADVAARRY